MHSRRFTGMHPLEKALSESAFVVKLQEALRLEGFYQETEDGKPLMVDGRAGQYTRQALQQWTVRS